MQHIYNWHEEEKGYERKENNVSSSGGSNGSGDACRMRVIFKIRYIQWFDQRFFNKAFNDAQWYRV